jgi:hypothetical protein
MTVMRAKMIVESVQRFQNSEKLTFRAVPKSTAYPKDGSDEDNTFAKWSPTADLTIQVTNPDLFGKLNPGEKYYVDFTIAELAK